MSITESLLQIKAIKLNVKNPFTWASGWKSPIYCDNRVILSSPEIRNTVALQLAVLIKHTFPKPDIIVGVATGAIGIGLMVAEKMQLPFAYVRPEPKKHGRKNQIEGVIKKEQRVVVVEDLISTGMSSINAVNAVRNQGVNVLGLVAIFTYGFEISLTQFQKTEIPFKTLLNYDNLIKEAIKKDYVSAKELETLQEWRKNPSEWG